MIRYKTSITAHSGADDTQENSMEFVRYAVASDADAIEVDVRRDPKNGVLILAHDKSDDGAHLLLRHALELISQHTSMCINCDLKEPGLEQQAAELAGQMGLSERLIFSGTVNPMCLENMPIKKQQIYWNIDEQIPGLYQRCRQNPAYVLQAAEEMCSLCISLGIQTVNVYEGLVDDSFLNILDRHGIGISVWTVNEETRLSYFLSRGVRNITTRKLTTALSMRQQEES